MSVDSPADQEPEVRAAEMIATLCLATDLGMELPLEHGLHSTLVAMRLAERLGVAPEVATQTYYGCLLFYAGCTADAEVTAELFDEGALAASFTPVMFGTPGQTLAGILRALAGTQGAPAMGVSAKTADHHVQHVYAKIGVSTRAAAALVAMRHGLAAWGELPMVPAQGRS